jgi:hypothetical protein
MIAYFQRLFRVLPGEGTKLLPFALLAALLQGGVAVGMTAADSLFLTHLGAEKLPVIYLGMPLIMVLYAPVYSILVAKLGVDRLFDLTLALLVVGGAAFGASGGLLGEATPWLLYAMKFYVGLWFIALYTLFWNFADDYFSIRDGKRLYGIIAAGGAAGATAGAALVTALSRLLAPGHLFYAWAVLALLAFPVLAQLRHRHLKLEADDAAEAQGESPFQVVRFALGTFKRSRFALALAAVCFCAVNLTGLLEFLSLGVLANDKTPAQLARLLGELYAVASILTLLINLFGYNRLVGRIGVGNTALILPLAYLVAFAGFFLHHGFVAAILGLYAYQTVLASVEYNNVNLLFNAMPSAAKRPLRTFIEAMTEPVATALAGGFLLFYAASLGPVYVALTGVFAAVVALAVAAILRHDYGTALADNLRRDWLDFTPAPEYWQQHVTEADRVLLREKALRSPARVERIAATDLLGYIGDPEAGRAVAHLMATARPAEAEQLRPALNRILRSDDTATIAGLLLWLESDRSPEDPELLDEFTAQGALPVRQLPAWSRSRHPSRVAMTAIARWHGPRLDEAEQALSDVRGLLAGDAVNRRWGVRALGGFRHSQYARELLGLLAEPDAELRLEVLRALHKLAGPDTEVVLGRVLPLLTDATPDERQLILGIAEKVGTVGPITDLLLAASHFPAAENRQLEALIATFGPRAIATVIHVLRNPAASPRSRILAARTLGRLARPQLDLIAEDLMTTELRRAWDSAAAAVSLIAAADEPESDGVCVLRRLYRDSAAEGLDFALQLLGLTGRLPDVDLIQASLTFANAKDRANAIEAIEQSCSHDLFAQIRPLLAITGHAAAAGGQAVFAALPRDTVLRRASTSENALECAAALLAVGDTDPARARDFVKRRIDVTESPGVTATFAALLPYFEPTSDRGRAGLHPVERIAAFVQAEYFADARIAALEYLAARSIEQRSPEGATLYSPKLPTGSLIIVADGGVEVSQGRVVQLLQRGGTCNERSLMGTITRDEYAISRGSTVLLVPGATVARAIEIYPALGMSLYRTKIVANTT